MRQSVTNKPSSLMHIRRLVLLLLLFGFAQGASAAISNYCQADFDSDGVGAGAVFNMFTGACNPGYIWIGSCAYVAGESCASPPPGQNDNCTAAYNPSQLDANSNSIGDACEGVAQTITVTTPAPVSAVYNSTFPVAGIASSGLPVEIKATGGCTIAGGVVTMISGTAVCTLRFNQQGSLASGYAGAPTVTSTTTAIKAAQTITVTTAAPSTAANGSYFNVAATASSGLFPQITISGGCYIAIGIVTITSAVTACTVYYNVPSDANWAAAQVTSITAVNTGISQSITVTTAAPASALLFGSSFPVAATASSGLPVVISTSGSCSIAAGTVTLSSTAPNCTVTFQQGGNASYSAAPLVTNVVTGLLMNPTQISTGRSHACALDDTGVHCWGNNYYGQNNVPVLVMPVQVSAGSDHTCALDSAGVHCWGVNDYGQTTVPALINPLQVSAGFYHTCAIDSSGVHCWGAGTTNTGASENYGQSIVPALLNPLKVSAGARHTCALDSSGAHCWGYNGYGQTTLPVLVNPAHITTGYAHTCALDDSGVHCWGDNQYGQSAVPALVNPVEVSAGTWHTCALDSIGVHCWGYSAEGRLAVPALVNPVHVDTGGNFACALDDTGVHCWGYQAVALIAAQYGVDADHDSIVDSSDNCSLIANSNQQNLDVDTFGDVCDGDIDGDNVPNGIDADPLSAGNAVEVILPLDGMHNGAAINKRLLRN